MKQTGRFLYYNVQMLCILKGNVFLICMDFTNPPYILCRLMNFKTIQYLMINFLRERIQQKYNFE